MKHSTIVASLVTWAIAFFHTQPVMAAGLFFSLSGSGVACSQSAPCSLSTAISAANPDEELSCADNSDSDAGGLITKTLTIDCAGTAGSVNNIIVGGGAVVTLRNFTIWQVNYGIEVQSGTLIVDNVHITGAANAIVAQVTAPSTIIVRNCVFDTGTAGAVLLQPASGGSVNATFDHVTIAKNSGGGIHADSSNGPINMDITDSTINDNVDNGLAVSAGSSGQNNIISIAHTTIAKNGQAGVEVNGSNVLVLLDTTLLDSDASGATEVLNSGRILSFGNNRIVGSPGSGFTGSATLQ